MTESDMLPDEVLACEAMNGTTPETEPSIPLPQSPPEEPAPPPIETPEPLPDVPPLSDPPPSPSTPIATLA